MSLICFDGRTVSWDSAVSRGSLLVENTPDKMIIKNVRGEDFLIGGVGVLHEIVGFQDTLIEFLDDVFIDWLNNCKRWKVSKDTTLVVYRPKDQTFRYFESGRRLITTAKQSAVGCGEQFAMGAMAAGASAPKAVALACARVAHVAPPVNFYPLPKNKRRKKG